MEEWREIAWSVATAGAGLEVGTGDPWSLGGGGGWTGGWLGATKPREEAGAGAWPEQAVLNWVRQEGRRGPWERCWRRRGLVGGER